MPNMSEAMLSFTGMNTLAILFMGASFVLVADNRTVSRRARTVFLICIALVALIAAADWFNIVISPGRPELRVFHTVSMALTFALAPTFPVAIAETIFPERYAKWVFAILLLQALLEVATIFGGFVFWVDEAGYYHRGPLYVAYMASYFISALYLAYESIKAGRTYQSVNTLSILVILFFLAAGVGIQIVDSRIRTTWPAVGMVLFLYFQFYAEMILRTDALTLLLNRHSYEEFLKRWRRPCTAVLIDVDRFKEVNDNYGHAYGDECLQTIARLIRHAFGSAGQCFRTGGDEFSVMVTKHQDNVPAYIERLEQLVHEERASEPRLPTVSVGHAQAAGGGDELTAAIQAADEQMYAAKRARKAVRA